MKPLKRTALVALAAAVAIELVPFLGLLLCAWRGWTAVNHPFSQAMALMNMAGGYVVYELRFLLPGASYVPKMIVFFGILFVVQVAVIWLVIMMVMIIIRSFRRS